MSKFLELPLGFGGWIYEDALVGKSVMAQKPLALFHPQSNAYQCIRWIALQIAGVYVNPPKKSNGIRGFVTSFLKIK